MEDPGDPVSGYRWRVNFNCCKGCQKGVNNILQKTNGRLSVCMDPSRGMVTLSGNVEPTELIKMIKKARKRPEALSPEKKPTRAADAVVEESCHEKTSHFDVDGGNDDDDQEGQGGHCDFGGGSNLVAEEKLQHRGRDRDKGHRERHRDDKGWAHAQHDGRAAAERFVPGHGYPFPTPGPPPCARHGWQKQPLGNPRAPPLQPPPFTCYGPPRGPTPCYCHHPLCYGFLPTPPHRPSEMGYAAGHREGTREDDR